MYLLDLAPETYEPVADALSGIGFVLFSFAVIGAAVAVAAVAEVLIAKVIRKKK